MSETVDPLLTIPHDAPKPLHYTLARGDELHLHTSSDMAVGLQHVKQMMDNFGTESVLGAILADGRVAYGDVARHSDIMEALQGHGYTEPKIIQFELLGANKKRPDVAAVNFATIELFKEHVSLLLDAIPKRFDRSNAKLIVSISSYKGFSNKLKIFSKEKFYEGFKMQLEGSLFSPKDRAFVFDADRVASAYTHENAGEKLGITKVAIANVIVGKRDVTFSPTAPSLIRVFDKVDTQNEPQVERAKKLAQVLAASGEPESTTLIFAPYRGVPPMTISQILNMSQ